MNVVDSSGWLEYFANAPNAQFFAPAIEDAEHLVVPTITLFEVFKRIAQQCGEWEALTAATAMRRGIVAELTAPLAVAAAQVSVQHDLPLADSIILASARSYQATLWTQDAGFRNLEGVQYIGKL